MHSHLRHIVMMLGQRSARLLRDHRTGAARHQTVIVQRRILVVGGDVAVLLLLLLMLAAQRATTNAATTTAAVLETQRLQVASTRIARLDVCA